jgi:cytochrome b561
MTGRLSSSFPGRQGSFDSPVKTGINSRNLIEVNMKSTPNQYGRVAQLLHWISALLILFLIPMGFLMQTVDEGARLLLYRTHVILGVLVLGLTVVRLGWQWFDSSPGPPPGLAGTGLLAYKAVHWLLYLALLVLALSGIALNVVSGLGDILFGAAPGSIPTDLSDYLSRTVHGITARVYIGLLIAHIAGVVSYQATEGDVLKRMGLGGWGLSR